MDLQNGSYDNVMTYTTSGEYTYVVPYDGEYQLEVWGAQGETGMVNSASKYEGGYGAYSTVNVFDEIIANYAKKWRWWC